MAGQTDAEAFNFTKDETISNMVQNVTNPRMTAGAWLI